MKILNTWAAPLAASLILHGTMIVLLTPHLANSKPEAIIVTSLQAQAINVELMPPTATIVNKPRLQKSNPIILAQSTQTLNPTAEPIISSPVVEESAPSAITTEPSNTVAQEASSNLSSIQASPVSQPLSKLTRVPAFLRKIEPVYPLAEQRTGSQATVLAEVAIDDQGRVMAVKIAKSAGVHFDNAVIEALNKSYFTPGYIDKEAVAVRVLVPFRFNLK